MTESTAIALRSLSGRPCPEDVVLHARSAAKLTPRAVEHLPEVLDACITDAMSQPLAAALTQFSLRHEIAEADLGRTIRACRFLVREASAVDLGVEAFAEDFALLFPAPRELASLVVGRYEVLKKKIRSQLYATALAEHGAVLTDVAWRVDLVAATSDATRLMMPVAMLTMTYKDGGESRRMTLQVPGDVLLKLRDAADIMAK